MSLRCANLLFYEVKIIQQPRPWRTDPMICGRHRGQAFADVDQYRFIGGQAW
jgi:hypothetical protein